MEFSKLRITPAGPDFTHGLRVDIAGTEERPVVNITGVNSTVPPYERSPPQIRAGVRDAIRIIVVGVFPRVVVHEGNLIHVFLPEGFNGVVIFPIRV